MKLSTTLRPERIGILTALVLCAAPAGAQVGSDRLVFPGTQADSNDGYVVRVLGDVDLDGWPDYAVGAYAYDSAAPDAGRIRVHSGRDGALLATFDGVQQGDQLGFAIDAVGDVDGDGRAELLAGTGSGRYALLLPGQGGAPLQSFVPGSSGEGFGLAVAGLGDLDRDGWPDLAVGAPNADGALRNEGRVDFFSGATGQLLRSVYGGIGGMGFGRVLADAGRVDADPRDDLIVGGNSGSNVVRVISGADGSTLRTFVGDFALDWFGSSVCSPGDVDGDGRADLAIGAPQSFLGAGYVRVYSGQSGALIRQHDGSAFLDLFGWSVAPAGDVDHDGRPDLLVGAPFFDANGLFNSGRANAYSGATGALLLSVDGQAEDGSLGWSVDGAACADPILGAPTAGTSGLARVIETEQRALPESTCVANPNSTGQPALMSWSGSTSVSANDLVLITTGCPNNAIGIHYWAPLSGQAPFGNGFNCTSGPVVRLGSSIASGGTAQRVVNLNGLPPAARPLPGQLRFAQFWYRNPAGGGAGFNLSDALRLPFCP